MEFSFILVRNCKVWGRLWIQRDKFLLDFKMFDFHIYFAFICVSHLFCSKLFSLGMSICSTQVTKQDLELHLYFKTFLKEG